MNNCPPGLSTRLATVPVMIRHCRRSIRSWHASLRVSFA